MAYNPNIPNAADFLSVSQAQIKNNFSDANTIFGFDHVTFNASSDNGKHNAVTMPDLTANPPTPAGVGYGQMVAIHSAADTSTQPRPSWNDNNTGISYPMAPIVAYATCITTTGGTVFVVEQEINCTVTSLHAANDQFHVALNPNLLMVSQATTSPGFWYGVVGTAGRNQTVPTGSPSPRFFTVANQMPTGFDIIITTGHITSSNLDGGAPDWFSFIVIQF